MKRSATVHCASSGRGRQAVVVLVLGLLVFANALPGGFVWEDHDLIGRNPFIRSLSSAVSFLSPSYWGELHVSPGRAYKPATMWSLAVDYRLWGLAPLGYHLSNATLHVTSALLLLALCRRLGERSVALAAALFFVVHPIHTEAVNWVKNRAELLSSVCVLAAMASFIRCCPTQDDDPPRTGAGWYALALAAFALGLLAKGTGLVACGLLIGYILLFLPRRWWRRALMATVPFWTVAVAYVLFLWLHIKAGHPSTDMADEWRGVMADAGRTTLAYIGLVLFPVRLALDRVAPTGFALGFGAVACLAVALSLRGLSVERGRRSVALFGLLWGLACLSPAAYTAPMAGRPMAEQRAYLASVGFCILVASALSVCRLASARGALVWGLALFMAAGTVQRNFTWRDEQTLWRDAVVKSPDRPRPHTMLADCYLRRGLLRRATRACRQALAAQFHYAGAHNVLGLVLAEEGHFQAAADAFRHALDCDRELAEAHNNLGTVLYKQGRRAEAIESFRTAVALNPQLAQPHANLGDALGEAGDLRAAIAEYETAVTLDPSLVRERAALASSLLKVGDYGRAAIHYAVAIVLAPERAELHNDLGVAYQHLGQAGKAIEALQTALRLRPDYAQADVNLGNVLLGMGRTQEAVAAYEKAARSDPSLAQAQFNLGHAYATLGRKAEAIAAYQRFLDLWQGEAAPALDARAAIERLRHGNP